MSYFQKPKVSQKKRRLGAVWDSGRDLLPTKTSRFAFQLIGWSLSCINGRGFGMHDRRVCLDV